MGFRDFQRKHVALREIERGNHPVMATPDSLHIQLIALRQDVARLRDEPQRGQRMITKRDVLLPKWRPYAERYLASGEVHQNPIFSYCTIWLFDVGDIGEGLRWADIAIEQQQDTPENIRRDFAHFTADFVLEWAEREAAVGHAIEPYFSQTFERVRTRWRLNEVLTSKWFKFAGLFLLRDDKGVPRATAVADAQTLRDADALLAEAERLYQHAQVRTHRQKIAARLRALNEE
ncbi:MAG: phage terminase small subunit [Plesiomonas sp.]|uniref:Terminase n=1 Tax=Plesiomonas shigelloides TaxID=703 RepID=A0A8I2B5D0_PLESH|nr:phage terminase small subunit [Plesiomonas shigelloides]MBO1107892.1 terminase [Plesiomonas shigelloides]